MSTEDEINPTHTADSLVARRIVTRFLHEKMIHPDQAAEMEMIPLRA